MAANPAPGGLASAHQTANDNARSIGMTLGQMATQAAVNSGNPAAQHTGGPMVVQQARSRYPILQKLNIAGVSSPGAQPYELEFWGPHDTGSQQEPRPASVPMGHIGVQVFHHTRPIDVLADVASHYLRHTDPTMHGYYQQFLKSLTPAQKARLHVDYRWSQQHEHEQRPFKQWAEQTRLPAYFRGYTFKQWSPKFTNKLFTPQQINLFNQVRQYLGVKGDK